MCVCVCVSREKCGENKTCLQLLTSISSLSTTNLGYPIALQSFSNCRTSHTPSKTSNSRHYIILFLSASKAASLPTSCFPLGAFPIFFPAVLALLKIQLLDKTTVFSVLNGQATCVRGLLNSGHTDLFKCSSTCNTASA